jgi:hypothetical protein
MREQAYLEQLEVHQAYAPPLPAPPPPPAPANPVLSCEYMLSYLEEDTLRDILARVAKTSPSALAAITLAYEELPEEE